MSTALNEVRPISVILSHYMPPVFDTTIFKQDRQYTCKHIIEARSRNHAIKLNSLGVCL
jgi:hypothetical protein